MKQLFTKIMILLLLITVSSQIQAQCNGQTTLTTPTGAFSDGSGLGNYQNYQNCQWLIQPTNGGIIVLTFSDFDIEYGYDFVTVYDGTNTSGTLLGQFSGANLPPNLTATSGAMYVTFMSDNIITYTGFEATYTSGTIATTATQQQAVSCFGGNDGIAEITVLSNTITLPFTVDGISYNTNPFTITGLSGGNNTFSITDGAGDSSTVSLMITQPSATYTATNVTCNGANDGTITMIEQPIITEILDTTGDGTNSLTSPFDIYVDESQNVFVSGASGYSNVLKTEPNGTVTEIIGFTGDGTNNLYLSYGLAGDNSGNIYVTGASSHNAYKIEPNGTITQIIDASGDGTNSLNNPRGIAVDYLGNVYVAAFSSDNVFKIEPNGTITQIMDASGDGINSLDTPNGVAVDNLGNVYVAGIYSNNVFKIEPNGTITQIMDASGDGINSFSNPNRDITVDNQNNLYVTGAGSDNVFKIEPNGTITQILDASGNGAGIVDYPYDVATDKTGNVYVTCYYSDNAFKIEPNGTVTQILDITGDGTNAFDRGMGIAVDSSNNVYVSAETSNNVFKINQNPNLSYSINGLNYQTSPFNNVAPGNYTISVQGSANCYGEVTIAVSDTILPILMTQNITINLNADGNTTITANDLIANSSDNCNPPMASIDKTYFTTADFGENTVMVTVTDDAGNSTSMAAIVTVEYAVNTTNVNKDAISITTYPNPVQDMVRLKMTNINEPTVLATLSDINGRLINNYQLESQNAQIDVSTLPQGNYFIRIQTKETVKTVRFIKQ